MIKKRPMDAEEREEWNEELGYDLADEEAFIYLNLPEEGKEVFITTSWGSVTTDAIGYDVGFYWEEHDMEDVLAWMPLPEGYKEGTEEQDKKKKATIHAWVERVNRIKTKEGTEE